MNHSIASRMKVPAIMNILALLLFVLLTSAIPFEANSTSDKPPISGAGHLHRRMEAFHPDELRHLYQEGWEYLALLYLGDKDLTTRYIQELIHQGKELRGENGHRQRDWLNRGSVQDLWTFYPCSDDKKDFSTIFVALEDILPEGGAAQEESERAHRPNLALWQPAGPNRCVKWRQDHDYTPPGKNVRIEATEAKFQAVYNVRDGMVIIQRVVTPEDQRNLHYEKGPQGRQTLDKHAIFEEMPRIKDWEDLLFISWEMDKEMATNAGHPAQHAAPRWLIQQSAWGGDKMLRIIWTCLKARGFDINVKKEVPIFPGQIFFAGGWCFNALLQTEQSIRFVWLLALHKEKWGEKALTSVRIFRGDRENEVLPSLIWEVEDATHEKHADAEIEYKKGLGGP